MRLANTRTAPDPQPRLAGKSDMTAPKHLVLQFDATELAVRDTLAQLPAFMERAGLGDEDAGRVEIVLAEALNNVVEHAYAGRPTGRIELRCTVQSGRIDTTILDQGRPVPVHVFAKRRPPVEDPLLDDLPEGGFGWLLIQTLTENLSYQRVEGTNCLRLAIPLAPTA